AEDRGGDVGVSTLRMRLRGAGERIPRSRLRVDGIRPGLRIGEGRTRGGGGLPQVLAPRAGEADGNELAVCPHDRAGAAFVGVEPPALIGTVLARHVTVEGRVPSLRHSPPPGATT